MVIAAENATFGITPAKLGVPYNLAGIQNMLGSVPLVVVKEMLFRAAPISARRAYEVGIANYVLPTTGSQDIRVSEGHAVELGLVITLLKEEIHVLAHAQPLTTEIFERIQGGYGAGSTTATYQEGIRSFFEKRKPVFQGK
jgi:methylmalonyl-CoA decarboxylase